MSNSILDLEPAASPEAAAPKDYVGDIFSPSGAVTSGEAAPHVITGSLKTPEDPSFLDQVISVVAFPYNHPLITGIALGCAALVAYSYWLERHTGISLLDRAHKIANPFCNCHRCNPWFIRERGQRIHAARPRSEDNNPFN